MREASFASHGSILLVGEPEARRSQGLTALLSRRTDLHLEHVDWPAFERSAWPGSARMIVADASAPAGRIDRFLAWVVERLPSVPTLAIVPSDLDEVRLGALAGAVDDFVVAPLRETELLVRVDRFLARRPCDLARAHERLSRELGLAQLAGSSPVFSELLVELPRIATSNATVLLTGETGTGKELFARALHHLSRRQSRPFVPVECGAIPEHLAENELFGHARGAYTDARSDQKGLVALAAGGTLFIDEIDALSLVVQAKLLRFLQEGSYRPLGNDRFLSADVRVIAATNRSLEDLVERQTFRRDLFFRLNVVRLHLPPLRERPEDITLLSELFLDRIARDSEEARKTLSVSARRTLEAHAWPGNVRELLNVLRRAALLSTRPVILPADLRLAPPSSQAAPEATVRFYEARSHAIQAFERRYVEELLLRHAGNVTRAAQEAGKERRSFGRLVKKYGIPRPPALASS